MIASGPKPASSARRQVPIAWQALEDAFENNAPEVHSYLNLDSGEVIRIVDGIAEPSMHARIASDAGYLRVDPVSSREQYRWMEHFIVATEEGELRDQLIVGIEGKGAFRRFKDVLMAYPVDRERWFTFRSERLRTAMQVWCDAHGIQPVERPEWKVPTAEQVRGAVEAQQKLRPRRGRAEASEATRARLRELVDALPVRALDAALEFLEFLRERKALPRVRSKGGDGPEGEEEGSPQGGARE